MNHRRSVVIAGGGFGRTAVARQLAGRLPAEVDLKLTSEDSHTTFNPLLPEAVGALSRTGPGACRSVSVSRT